MGRALIVSAGASSNEYIAARLAEMGYARPVILPSGAEARRRMPDADFDLIVVNAVRMPATQGLKIPLIVPQFAILLGWTLMSIYNIGHLLRSIATPEWKKDDNQNEITE